MENKINAHIFVMGLLTIILTLLFSLATFFYVLEVQNNEYLKYIANTVSDVYEHLDNTNDLADFADDNIRITLIGSDGTILFESEADIDKMENHLERPEVAQAIEKGTGSDKRTSKTLGQIDYYFAVREKDGNILRVSASVEDVYSIFASSMPYLGMLLILMLVLSIVISLILTKKIVRPINKIAKEIDKIDLSKEDTEIYDELVPFIHEIKQQRGEIKRQLAYVNEEKEKLAAIIKNMAEGIIILDNDQNIIMANESAERYFNFSEQSLNKNIIYVLRDTAFIDCIRHADDPEGSHVELKLNKRHLKVLAHAIYSENEKIGIICLIINVTTQFKADKMRREFTANVSHELKTPLTSISGYAELIETGMAKDEDACHFAKKIHDESARMLSLVRDIIKLSELDELDLTSGFVEVDLFEIAKKAAETVVPMAEKRGITIKVEGESNIVFGDMTMLTELVFNLCDNAVRYNKENGSVRVSVYNYIVSVKDTGIGIPEKHLPRIFERFYRVDKSRSKQTGGTGLGLAIVKHIAEQHGAELSVHSIVGEFTEITVDFTNSQRGQT
ncbi:MAG: ATP-binding protein [Acutalibacteraceae bacterium]